MKRCKLIAMSSLMLVLLSSCTRNAATQEAAQSAEVASHSVVTIGMGDFDSAVTPGPSAVKNSSEPTPSTSSAAPVPSLSAKPVATESASVPAPTAATVEPSTMVTDFDDREPDLDKALNVTSIYDSMYGLRLDVPESYQDGVHCNTTTFTPFAFYEPTSNAALSGGGRIWTIGVHSYEDFLTYFGQDGAEWTSSSLGASDYMLGRTEDYVFVLSFPTDAQSTESTQAAYQDYQTMGHQLVADFLVINNIEANPDWQSFYGG